MSSKKKMSLKAAMQLFEQLETVPASATDVETAINVIINSNDISHMTRKGLHNVVWFLVDNIERCRVETEIS
jgi:hypothetical protein